MTRTAVSSDRAPDALGPYSYDTFTLDMTGGNMTGHIDGTLVSSHIFGTFNNAAAQLWLQNDMRGNMQGVAAQLPAGGNVMTSVRWRSTSPPRRTMRGPTGRSLYRGRPSTRGGRSSWWREAPTSPWVGLGASGSAGRRSS